MPKMKDLRKEGLFSTPNILEEVKRIYKITAEYEDKSIKRHIQRFFKEHHISFVQIGNGRYYKRKAVDSYLSNEKTIKHFNYITSKNLEIKTDEALMIERKAELDEKRRELYESWKKAGLTVEEGKFLEIDKITRKEYLTVDELLYLDKKGLVLKSDLNNEETEDLRQYYIMAQQSEREDKEIEEIFHKKKIEIMITALFNEHFILDEKTLHNDISLYVRGGENSIVYTEYGLMNEDKIPDQSVTRANLRLQDINNYIIVKK